MTKKEAKSRMLAKVIGMVANLEPYNAFDCSEEDSVKLQKERDFIVKMLCAKYKNAT